MRSSLAIASLLALGVLLILVGFIRVPYLAVETQTVAVITSRTYSTANTYTLATTLITTSQQIVTSEETYLSTITKVGETTYTKLDAVKLLNITALIPREQKNLTIGPFTTEGEGILSFSWLSDDPVQLSLVVAGHPNQDKYTSPLISRGAEEIHLSNDAVFYLVIKNSSNKPVYVNVEMSFRREIVITETYTTRSVKTIVETLTSTSTVYDVQTSLTTITEVITTKTAYPTTVVRQVTQTRYQELTFSTAMGTFLVFVSVMFIILLRKLRYGEETDSINPATYSEEPQE